MFEEQREGLALLLERGARNTRLGMQPAAPSYTAQARAIQMSIPLDLVNRRLARLADLAKEIDRLWGLSP